MEPEKLFIDIQGPRLQALRFIYSPDYIDNGFRVGIGFNTYKANCMTLQYINSKYIINLYQNKKYKWNKITKQFDPPVKKLVLNKEFKNLNELNNFIYKILEEKYKVSYDISEQSKFSKQEHSDNGFKLKSFDSNSSN